MNKENSKTRCSSKQISAQTEKTPPYVNHGGRFVTLNIQNSKHRQSFCAKILNVTDKYVTFENVNDGSIKKIAKTSIL